jgi:hypothetical protein
MKRRLALWGVAGFVVAISWVLLSIAIPLWSEPILWRVAQVSCPIVFFSHFAIDWYWVVLSNVPVYLFIGIAVEGLLQLRHLRTASA